MAYFNETPKTDPAVSVPFIGFSKTNLITHNYYSELQTKDEVVTAVYIN